MLAYRTVNAGVFFELGRLPLINNRRKFDIQNWDGISQKHKGMKMHKIVDGKDS